MKESRRSTISLFFICTFLILPAIVGRTDDKVIPNLDKLKPGEVKNGVLVLCPGEIGKVRISSKFQSEGKVDVKSGNTSVANASSSQEGEFRYVNVQAGSNNSKSPIQTEIEVTTTYVKLGEGDVPTTSKLTVVVLSKYDKRCRKPGGGGKDEPEEPKEPPDEGKPGKGEDRDPIADTINKGKICVNQVLYLNPLGGFPVFVAADAKKIKVESSDPSIASSTIYSAKDATPKLVVVGKAPGKVRITVTITDPPVKKKDGTIGYDTVTYEIQVVVCTGPTAPKKPDIKVGEGFKPVSGNTVEIVPLEPKEEKKPSEFKTLKEDTGLEPTSPAENISITNTLVGLVTPADAKPGEQVSGRVVTDPKRYKNVPGLRVYETEAPLRQVGGQATLTGLVVDTPEDEPQQAEDRIRFRIPEQATQIVFTLLTNYSPGFSKTGSSPVISRGEPVPSRGEPPVISRGEPVPGGGGQGCCTHLGQQVNCPAGLPAGSESLRFVQGGAIWQTPDGKEVTAPVTGLTPCNPPTKSSTYEAPPVIQPGTVQVVRGTFDGDSSGTAVKIGDKSCDVIAESPRGAYVDVPPDIPKGATEMTVQENGQGATIPVCGLKVAVTADKLNLRSGEKTKAHYVISGPEELPASTWLAGVANELINVGQLAALDPKGKFPKKGEEGKLLVTIVSSGSIKMKGGNNNMIVKWLDRKDFEDGPYKDDLDLQATAPGGFGLTVTAYSFLAPVQGKPL